MSPCLPCARAVHDPLTRDYRRDCPGCGVRELAHMPAAERDKQLLNLQHLCGPGAVKRVREDVRVEMARIKAIREGAKERT